MPNDPTSILFACTESIGVVGTSNAIILKLPQEMRKQFRNIFSDYLARFGSKGVYQRMNNRTIAQILAEYVPGTPEIVASGEADGVRYTLYEKLDQTADGSGQS